MWNAIRCAWTTAQSINQSSWMDRQSSWNPRPTTNLIHAAIDFLSLLTCARSAGQRSKRRDGHGEKTSEKNDRSREMFDNVIISWKYTLWQSILYFYHSLSSLSSISGERICRFDGFCSTNLELHVEARYAAEGHTLFHSHPAIGSDHCHSLLHLQVVLSIFVSFTDFVILEENVRHLRSQKLCIFI